jgi:hypothetical protein
MSAAGGQFAGATRPPASPDTNSPARPAHELPAGLPTPEGARQGVPSLTCGAADQSSPEIDMNTAAPAFWGEAFPGEAAGAMLRRMLPGLRADLAWIFGRRAADLPRTLPAEMYDGHPTP